MAVNVEMDANTAVARPPGSGESPIMISLKAASQLKSVGSSRMAVRSNSLRSAGGRRGVLASAPNGRIALKAVLPQLAGTSKRSRPFWESAAAPGRGEDFSRGLP